MGRTGFHPRHGRLLRALRTSLVAGALYDVAFAAVMVVAPSLPERIFGLPQPGESFYLWLIAVLLCMLAAFYLLAAWDPVSYHGNVAVAIGGRTAGGVVLLLATVGRPDLAGLLPLAIGDLVFAALHAFFWWPIRT